VEQIEEKEKTWKIGIRLVKADFVQYTCMFIMNRILLQMIFYQIKFEIYAMGPWLSG
jgi:hypothetical protein